MSPEPMPARGLQGAPPEDCDARRDTEHFALFWRSAQTSPEEAERGAVLAQRFHGGVAEALGGRWRPEQRLSLVLEGDAHRDGEFRGVPHVDPAGRIHVFRYPAGYFGELAHELVHAFRYAHVRHLDGFLEEGLAEMIGVEVDPDGVGFPRYGYPLDVVAGHWLARGEGIPLGLLRRHHARLNLPCMAQAYTLRASFFGWMRDRFGRDALLELADPERPAELPRYAELFGRDFDSLERDWRAALLARFESHADAERLVAGYRSKTPVQFWKICREGVDFPHPAAGTG